MTRDAKNESVSRLEQLRSDWDFNALQQALQRGAPVVAELGLGEGLDLQAALDDRAPGQFESAFGAPPMQLEAIVRAVGRPPLPVRNGMVVGKSTLPEGSAPDGFPADTADLISAIEPKLESVGRIQFYNHSSMQWGGTGWCVGSEADGSFLIVTNRHVAKLVARRTWMGGAVFMLNSNNTRLGASIDFLKEDLRMDDTSRDFTVEEFTYIAEDLAADIALARVKAHGDTGAFRPHPLELASQDAEHEDLIGVCGFPAADGGRNDVTEMGRYFQGLYGIKRFSPGYVIHPLKETELSHDATTTGGASGSPIFSLSDKEDHGDGGSDLGKVVGLHFAGDWGVGNSAVRVSTLRALLDHGATGSVVSGGIQTESRDGTHEADHFEGRTGYDPNFLQVQPVPLPTPTAAFPLSPVTGAPASNPHELRYQHFSILYSGAIKTPLITALNIDGRKTQPVKDYGRWHKDLRLPAEEQLSQQEYGHDEIDRGHLVRRAATNWGDTEDIANLSNRDSYHYTVAAPQHRRLNRYKDRWLGLEDYIMHSARTHGFKASVFTGPVISGADPQLGETGAPVPNAFFKVVVMAAAMPDLPEIIGLHATAYVLSQGDLIAGIISDRGLVEATEGFTYGAHETYQIRVRDLEAQTGHDFGPLADFDPLDRIESPQSLAVKLEDYQQIRL